ncbi:MAG TPA: serine hydrolase [Hyphomonadaceae bacterium]|jgi:CubicO group peptidase (beta-lactamase class C family)|nr:serine hydrolase [Hyphomonadaceae bacterium]
MTRLATRALAATALSLTLLAGCSALNAVTSAVGGGSSYSAPAAQLGMPTASPESVGYSTAGLDAVNKTFHDLVDQQKLAGVTTMIARHGKVVSFDTYGKANASTGEPLRPDSIFRIASMTKPTIGVAMMQLHEKGLWKLSDPVAKFIPEFANLQVKTANGTEPQKTPMTMAQLMSHSAGFDVSAGYTNAGLQSGDLQGMIDKLKALPLAYQPGTDWRYGPSVDIQGYIVQKLSGVPLDQYMQKNVFEPLGMVDTGFWVPESKAARVVAIHTYDTAGKITAQPQQNVRTSLPAFVSGSGGLMSTTKDYWRFAQAVSNGGQLDGKRVLKPETIRLMRTNVLQPGVKVDLYGPSMEGIGFGMDFAIVMDPHAANTQQGKDTFYWGGAYGTWFWIDPTNDVVFVGMIQNLNGSQPTGGTPPTRAISYKVVYDALTDKSK